MSVFNYPAIKNGIFKFGVTMMGDGGFDYSWTDRLDCVIGAAISSRTANKDFEDALFRNRNKVIYRPMISAFGGTKIEPGIPKYTKILNQMSSLIDRGFPVKQIVPQINPIMPIAWLDALNQSLGINYLKELKVIMEAFRRMNIRRIGHSFLRLDPITSKALWKIDNRLSYSFENFYFNPHKEIALNVIDDSFAFDTSDNLYYPYAKINYTVSNDDLAVLGLDQKYEFQTRMSAFKNVVQLINSPKENCKGMCVLCPFGNIKKFSIFNER